MNVREVMTTDPRCVAPQDTIRTAARIMRDEDTGVVPVVESDNRPVGVITDRDIVVRAIAEGLGLDATVNQIASAEVVSVSPDASVGEAAQMMAELQIRRLPVVEGGRLVGIVSLGDIAVKEGNHGRAGSTLENISEGVKGH
jgi:CBS domain-containing protein